MYRYLLFFQFILFSPALSYSIPIIPTPQHIQYQDGTFDLSQSIHFVSELSPEKYMAVERLQSTLEKKLSAKGANTVWLGIPAKDARLRRYCKSNNFLTDSLGKEGYQLVIRPDSIIIAANAAAGLLYGVQSLQQLFRAYTVNAKLPCLQITDYPAFRYRAVMDDISRGPIPNMAFLKKQIRRLSELKINVLTFYIEHVVKTRKHPAFAPEEGITIAEFKELSAYAKNYNIELIGSFQSLGHFRNVLNAPEYRHLGASDRMLQPGATSSIQFLTDVYEEMLPAFSSNYFNINADEAWDLTRGALKSIADSLGADFLYAQHVVPLMDYLLKNGKKPMIWGDMLLAYPKAFEYLPKESTILTWNYDGLESFAHFIDPIKEKGFDFWICPGVLNSYRLFPDFEQTFTNIQNFICEGYEKGASGVMTTVWDDGGRALFSNDWYGIAYAAEQSWQPNTRDFTDFERRFSQVFYQDKDKFFPTLLNIVLELKHLGSTQKLNEAFLAEKLLPEIGEHHRLNVKDLELIDNICKRADPLLTSLENRALQFANNLWYQDLPYWRFLLDHLQQINTTYQQILDVAKLYQSAFRNQTSKDQLEEALTIVQNLKKDWEVLKVEYQKLWLKESRSYWMEEASSVFNSKIQDLQSLETLLTFAFKTPEEKALPKPEMVKLAISPTQERYFTFWLISDPFPISDLSSDLPDFLEDLGGELQARPTPYDWQKYQSLLSDKIKFKQLFDSISTSAVVYAYCRIESPEQQEVLAKIDFDQQLEVILNSQKVSLSKVNSNSKKCSLPLKEGKNHLILKFLIAQKSQEFSFHLPKVDVRNRKQKYQLLSD